MPSTRFWCSVPSVALKRSTSSRRSTSRPCRDRSPIRLSWWSMWSRSRRVNSPSAPVIRPAAVSTAAVASPWKAPSRSATSLVAVSMSALLPAAARTRAITRSRSPSHTSSVAASRQVSTFIAAPASSTTSMSATRRVRRSASVFRSPRRCPRSSPTTSPRRNIRASAFA